MCKELIYLLFLLLFLSSCEQIYTPAIDKIEGELVVEGLITNDPSQNHVLLTKTTSFYDKLTSNSVTGAKVSLVEINGNVIQGIESAPGNFNFNLIPVVGQKYKIQILFNNDTYESEVVTMPPVCEITNFYTGDMTKKVYQPDAFGVPVASEVTGRELYVDAPMTPELSNYRFYTRAVLEWIYSPHPPGGPPPPPTYGWQSYYTTGSFDIAGPKLFSQASKIEKQPLMLLTYNSQGLLKPDSIFNGWIVMVDEYGTSQGSYDFHAKLNSQFEATGSLFDPIETQIYGNIKCITDSSKIAYGYFDLNSYRQYRYYLYFYNPATSIIQREITRYPFITDHGTYIDTPPDWWE